MAILKILQYPDLRLRRKGYLVSYVRAVKIRETVENMVETLRNTENCAALASTQLNINDPPSIIVINNIIYSVYKDILCLINPQIITQEGEAFDEEGCMSIYPQNNIHAQVKRATKIIVSAFNTYGDKIEFEAKNHLARCIQHECDHLQGILYIDHLTKQEQLILNKKIAEIKK